MTATAFPEKTIVQTLALTTLHPSPTNPRKTFDEGTLKELAASIAQRGVLQPIVARPHPTKKDHFEVVAGERRYRAAKLNGFSSIPGIVQVLSDQDVLEIQIIENSQRDDVHPLDEAEGFAALMKLDPKYTADYIGEKIGKSKSHVYQRIKLSSLVEAGKKLFRQGEIEAGHAILLARLAPKVQDAVIAKMDDETSVRELGRWIRESVNLDLHSAPFKKDDATFQTDVDTGNQVAVEQKGRAIVVGDRVLKGKTEYVVESVFESKGAGTKSTLLASCKSLPPNVVGVNWQVKDLRLVTAGKFLLPACAACPHRTGFIPELFPDVEKGDTCTLPPCFNEKKVIHIRRRSEQLATEMGQPVAVATVGWVNGDVGKALNITERIAVSEYEQGPMIVPDGKRIFAQRKEAESVVKAGTDVKAVAAAKKVLASTPAVRPVLVAAAERNHGGGPKVAVGDVAYVAEPDRKRDRYGVSKSTGSVATTESKQKENAAAKLKNAKARLAHRERMFGAAQLVAKVKHPLPLAALAVVARVLAYHTAGGDGSGKAQFDMDEALKPLCDPLKQLGLKSLKGLADAKPDLMAKALVRFAVQHAVESEWGGGENADELRQLGDLFGVDWKAVNVKAMELASKHDARVLAAKPPKPAPTAKKAGRKEKARGKSSAKKR